MWLWGVGVVGMGWCVFVWAIMEAMLAVRERERVAWGSEEVVEERGGRGGRKVVGGSKGKKEEEVVRGR